MSYPHPLRFASMESLVELVMMLSCEVAFKKCLFNPYFVENYYHVKDRLAHLELRVVQLISERREDQVEVPSVNMPKLSVLNFINICVEISANIVSTMEEWEECILVLR